MHQYNLLKTRRFLPLFITQFFGAFNDNAFKNALLIWVTYDMVIKVSMSIELIVIIASGLFILPFFLFSAIAGQFADSFEKSRLIQQIKMVEIVLMALVFVGFYLQNIVMLLLILFFMGVQSTFFGPLKYSLLPLHLKSEELVLGNSLVEAGTFISILLGTIIGGLLIRLDYGVEIVCGIVMLLALVGYIASCFIPKSYPDDSNLKVNFNIFKATLNIINYARKKRIVWLAIIGIAWFWFVGIIFLTAFPIYTKNIIKGDEKVVTLFLSIFSIGIAIGSMLCNKLLKGRVDGWLIPYGCLAMGSFIVLLFILSVFYQNQINFDGYIGISEFLLSNNYGLLISLTLLLLSIASGIYIVPLYAMMQYYCSKKHLARIIAANNVVNSLFMVLATVLLYTFVVIGFNIVEIFLLIGFCNLAIALLVKSLS